MSIANYSTSKLKIEYRSPVLPHFRPRWFPAYPKLREVHGATLTPDHIECCCGPVSYADAPAWVIGKTVYTNEPTTGAFDRLFRSLDDGQAMALATNGTTKVGNIGMRRKANRGDVSATFRQGNEYGAVINGNDYLLSKTPEALRDEIDAMLAELSSLGMQTDMAMPGTACRNIVSNHVIHNGLIRDMTLPGESHLVRFEASKRGGRMESVELGTVDCYDYDIRSAFPSEIANLISLDGATWVTSKDLSHAPGSAYAAVLARVSIPDMKRAPIGVSVAEAGDSSLFFPTGKFTAWLNLPEVNLLLDHPELGTIEEVYSGSWCIPATTTRPFHSLMSLIYELRSKAKFVPPEYWKRLAVASYGIMGHSYDRVIKGDQYVQAGSCWNPVFMSHITAAVRVRNYLDGMGQTVYGEYIDGIAVSGKVSTSEGLGGLRLEGSGPMVIWSDMFKESAWKEPPWPIAATVQAKPNARSITINGDRNVSLGDFAVARASRNMVGDPLAYSFKFTPGSTSRWGANGKEITGPVGRYMREPVHTNAPTIDQARVLYSLRQYQFSQIATALGF